MSVYLDKLKSSGVTEELANKFGLTYLAATELHNVIGFTKGSGAIKIPYSEDFARYRFLGTTIGGKYYQIPGTRVHAYCPRKEESMLDIAVPLLITEGEFKTLAAIENGFDCVGLSGVNCYLSDIKGVSTLIDPLVTLPTGKRVYICFDHDGDAESSASQNVRFAADTLAAMLIVRGCRVYIVKLGDRETIKIGLDDYLLNEGLLKFKALLKATPKVEFSKSNGSIYLLSRYLEFNGAVVNALTCNEMKIANFKITEANTKEKYIAGSKPKFSTEIYLASKYRTSITGMTVAPNCIRTITENNELNLWQGYHTKPVKGDISKWHAFEELLFRDEPELQEHFALFVACLFQKPGIKQIRLPIFQSRAEGIGKSLWAETIAGILNGTHHGKPAHAPLSPALVICGNDIGGSFNSHLKGVKLLVLNELGERGEKHTAFIKDVVSGSSIMINEKYKSPLTMINIIQPIITTNEDYTHIVTSKSRRELVLSIDEYSPTVDLLKTFLRDITFFDWLWSKEAQSAMMYYYMNYPLGDYDGSQPAPESKGKDNMGQALITDAAYYIISELGGVEHINPAREYNRFRTMTQSNSNGQSFRKALKDAGFVPNWCDKTHGQIKFPRDVKIQYPASILEREAIWSFGEAKLCADKLILFKAFLDRYYGGKI